MFRKKKYLVLIGIFIAIAMVCMPFLVDESVAKGEDNTPPKLKSVKVLDSTVKAGNDIKVRVTVEERGTGLKEAFIQFNNSKTDKIISPFSKTWTKPLYSSSSSLITYTFNIPTKNSAKNGDYFIGYLEFTDSKGNFSRYCGNRNNNKMTSEFVSPAVTLEGKTHVEIYGSTGDNQDPVLNSIKVNKTIVEKPSKITVIANITEYSEFSYVQIDLRNKNADKYLTKMFSDVPVKKGTSNYNFEIPISEKVRNGEWEVCNIYMKDYKGNESHYTSLNDNGYFVNYDKPSIKFNIPKFRVIGVSGDETDPKLNSIKVLNSDKTLEKPGVLKVELDLKEEDSGVTNIEFQVECIEGDEVDATNRIIYRYSAKGYGYNDDELTSSSDCPEKLYDTPLLTGKYTFNIPIASKYKNGKYKVIVWELKDRADNCKQYSYSGIEDEFTLYDEFDYDFEVGISNEELPELIANMEEGKVGKVYLSTDKSQNILTKEALEQLAGKDKKLVCYRSGYQWIFDGLEIDVDKIKDINLTTKIYTVSNVNLSSNQSAICLSFANNGQLPGKVQFRFKSAFVKNFVENPDDLYLYHVEGSDNYSENIDYINSTYDQVSDKEANFKVVLDDSDSWCYVDLTHNSKYLISKTKLSKLTMKNAKVSNFKKSFVYNGKYLKQPVKVVIAGKTLKLNKDYKITYKNNKYVGKATCTITGINKYKKLGSKAYTYKIYPKSTYISKLTKGDNRFTVKWKKQSLQTTGYQIKYSTSAKMNSAKYITVKSPKYTSKTIKNLKNKKTYYVQIRTYKKVSGLYYYSSWSKIKSIKTL